MNTLQSAHRNRQRSPRLPPFRILYLKPGDNRAFQTVQTNSGNPTRRCRSDPNGHPLRTITKINRRILQPVIRHNIPYTLTTFITRGILGTFLLFVSGSFYLYGFSIFPDKSHRTKVHQRISMHHLIKSGCFLTLAKVSGKRLVLIDNTGNGIGRIFPVTGTCKIPIYLLRRIQYFTLIPGGLTDIPHFRRNSIGQSPRQCIKTIHIGRSISEGPDGFRKIHIIRIVIFRTVKIPFQPGTSPVFTTAIHTSRFERCRIIRYGSTNNIFGQTIH